MLEVCNPPQYVIDMIPLGDDRDFKEDSQTPIVKHGDLVNSKRVGSCDIRRYVKKRYHADIEKSRQKESEKGIMQT